jgi:hypothetical protein
MSGVSQPPRPAKPPKPQKPLQPARRPPFQPDLLQGGDRSEVNRAFLRDAERWQLAFRCRECVFVCADGRCSLGWPNAALRSEDFEVVDEQGIAQFCKAFEPDDG